MLNIQIAMWFHLLFDTISNILSLPVTLMFFASDFNFLSQRLQFPPRPVWRHSLLFTIHLQTIWIYNSTSEFTKS